MRKLLVIICALASTALAQGPALTTVSDAIYGGSGTITITAPSTFTTADGYVIPQGWTTTATLGAGGAFTVQLPPNSGSTPASHYIANYNVVPAGRYAETWIVPSSGTPVRLSAVRSLLPSSPSYVFSWSQIEQPPNAISGCLVEWLSGTSYTCGTAGAGSVTSVALTAPPWLSVSGSPVTAAGTLGLAAATGQPLNEVLGTGSTGVLGLMTLTAASGAMVYPSAGVADSTGSAWGASYGVGTADGDLVQLGASGLPAVGGSLLTGLSFGQLGGAATTAQMPPGCSGCVLLGQGSGTSPAYVADPEVQGVQANGASQSGNNPVPVAGTDGTYIREFSTDASGRLNVNVNGTVPVSLASLPALAAGANVIGGVTQSGAWTVAISGNPQVQIQNDAPVVGAAADNTADSTAKMPTIPAVATTAAPAYTSGDMVPLSTDTGGNLRVTCANCGGGSGGTAMADAGAFTQGTTGFTPIGGEYNSSPTALTSGQAGAVLLTSTRHMDVSVADPLPAGTNDIGTVGVNGTVPVSGTFWQTTQPVSLASLPALPAGSAAIGTVGVTSLPSLAAGSNAIGSVSVSNFPATQPVSGTVTANAGTGFRIPATASAAINDSASGLTQVIAAVSGKAIYVTGYTVVATAAVTVQWEYGTGTACATGTTALTGPMSFAANGGAAPRQTLFVPSGDALCLNLGAAVQVGGSVSYAQQ